MVVVVGAAILTLGTRMPRTARRLVVVGSLGVMAAGAFWFVQRVFFPGGIS